MSIANHTNEKVNEFILNNLAKVEGMNLVKAESKESIVLEEKEITWVCTFKKPESEVSVSVVISDPLYFCDITFAKSDNNYFPFKSYLENVAKSNELEDLFENFIDEKIAEEEYIMSYLNVFKKHVQSADIQKIIAGESWPEVPRGDD
jgi:hypothetical protein